MLNNKNAGKVFSILQKFKEANLEVNCQIVLVPEVNDGEELERTLKDLSSLYPSVKSVAIVPVGITKYREGLAKIRTFNKLESKEFLKFIKKEQEKFLKKLGTRFAFASDEFYVMAEMPLPNYDDYEGFPQLENGVGLMKSFEYEVEKELKNIKQSISLDKNYIIATGTLAKNFMEEMANKVMNKFQKLKLNVIPINNEFFGETITVSGLVTGIDLINQLKDIKNVDGIIIPKSMLRKDSNIFLDDITIEDIEKQLKTQVIPVEVSGKEFVNLFRKA